MNYSIEQLPNKRWGIYAELRLLATIGSYQNALTILTLLQSGKECKARQQKISSVKNPKSSHNQAA